MSKGLFAVSDGLGGEGHGEQASYIAVNNLKNYQETFGDIYMTYIQNVNDILCREQFLMSSNMGCTLAALYAENDTIKVLNIGDSRVYKYGNSELDLLTVDHSEFATMLKYGVLTEADYYTSPTRNRLTRILGMNPLEGRPDPFVVDVDWCDKDIFMICSDGLSGSVTPIEMKSVLEEKISLLSQCKKLVKKAINHGSDDNITVMLIKVRNDE